MDIPKSIPWQDLRFLVVEDHGFQRWAVEHLLKKLGATQIFSAQDGKEALDILRTVHPPVDIVVTDLNMPGMDGIEFIRHVALTGMACALVVVSEQDPSLVASVASMTESYGGILLQSFQKPLTAAKLTSAIARYRKPSAIAEPVVQERSYTASQVDAAVRNGEIEPFFQAKVDLVSGELKGVEALARWRNPDHGIVMPGAFLPLLESQGVLDEMTMRILQQATTACRAWRARGSRATVSVNLSPTSLEELSLADRLARTVQQAGLEPRDVVFEITETAAASKLGHVLQNLSRLRMIGFGLSIDDFGTGYSTMQQLGRIPFTELKIDQSFVRAGRSNRTSRAILESSLDIARRLRLDAVAEGVELESEVQMLREFGCALAQGYFIGRPLPADEFETWLAAGARSPIA
jgi:EAL domain-containing protein (putative c-di-GMP-specific phosphodiesterase class I)/FixJ family two-component response regulator